MYYPPNYKFKRIIVFFFSNLSSILIFMLSQIRIYDFYGRKKHALPTDMDKTLDDANIQMDQEVGFLNLPSDLTTILFHCSLENSAY